MIIGMHPIVYSDDPGATRAFFRDVLQLPFIVWDRAHDWLMFAGGPSEVGVHPTRMQWQGETYESPRHIRLSIMCDDLDATMAELAGRGATFTGQPRDEEWGRVVGLAIPGADDLELYEPSYAPAFVRSDG